MSGRQRHHLQQDRAAQLVAAWLNDADADVSNLTADAIGNGPEQAIYALAALVVAAVERLSVDTADRVEVLAELGAAAFGRSPKLNT